MSRQQCTYWNYNFMTRYSLTVHIPRQKCTYCGGDVEDTFSTAGLLAACFFFPLGDTIE